MPGSSENTQGFEQTPACEPAEDAGQPWQFNKLSAGLALGISALALAGADSAIAADTASASYRFDLNMHDYGNVISNRGCGIISLTDAVSFALQRRVSVGKVWKLSSSVFTYPNGNIRRSHYMDKAAPRVARHFHLNYYKTSLKGGRRAINNGGAAIMLAAGGPGNPITHGSHYFESDQVRHGKYRIHDPNQAGGRHFDKSHRSPRWLRGNGTANGAWVIKPKS
jgi:hypothetical protein